MTRALPRASLALLLAALTACGGSSGSSDEAAPADAAPQVQPGATLRGFVGTDDDPEAYVIGITSEDGEELEAIAAGSYTLVVEDPSQIHNFVLSGDGVDVATDVRGTGEETFQVTFEAGTYTYVCDPHPSMSGQLRVV